MKLRNKKTGEIIDINLKTIEYPNNPQGYPKHRLYTSLTELNSEWEDYEEPKEYWFISDMGQVHKVGECYSESVVDEKQKEIGNYFETKEEAEKVVEKLKTWKRLKDKGFKFTDWNCALQEINFEVPESFYDRQDMLGEAISEETTKDLDLLFGGEE